MYTVPMRTFTNRTRLQRALYQLSRSPFWRGKRWRITLGVSVILLALLVRFVAEIGYDLSPDSRFQITRVIDGDTVELTGGERLRLLFIDTPERGEPYYDSASALVTALALGKFGDLRFGKRKRDGYGRLLATLYVDTLNINRELLRRGYANLYLFPDNLKDSSASKQVKKLLTAQREALAEGLGLWSIARSKEEKYITTRRSLRFHRPSCRMIHNHTEANLRVFDRREQALSEGLSPCRVCRP